MTRGRGGTLELRTEPLPEIPPELAALLGEEKPTAPVAVPVEAGKS